MEEKVKKILADTFRVKTEDITPETTMESIDTWDSLTHMELVANLEQELQIEFDGDEIAEMFSVESIQKIVSIKK